MASTKSGATLIPRGTSITAGGKYGGATLCRTDYGSSVNIQITNGATGPTVQAVAQVLASWRAAILVTGCTFVGSVVTVTCNPGDMLANDWVYITGIGGITNVAGFFQVTSVSAGTSFQFTAYSAPSGSFSTGGSVYSGFVPISQPVGSGMTANAVNGVAVTTLPGINPWDFPVDASASAVGVAISGNTGQAVTAWVEWRDLVTI